MLGAPRPTLPTDAAQWVTDHDAHTFTTSGNGDEYRDLAYSAPLLMKAMDYAAYASGDREDIWDAIDAAVENSGVADFTEPVDTGVNSNCVFTRAEAINSYAAKIAHALYHEVIGTFPWSITGLSEANLRLLLDATFLYSEGWDLDGATPAEVLYVVDDSPARAYTVSSANYTPAASHEQALANIIVNVGETYHHGGGGDPTESVTIEDSVLDGISRGTGCWFASRLMVALMGSLNIPGQVRDAYYNAAGHGTSTYPTANRAFGHGDDLYSGTHVGSVGATRCPTYDDWATDVLPHGPAPDATMDYNSVKLSLDASYVAPGTGILQRFQSQDRAQGWPGLDDAIEDYATLAVRNERYAFLKSMTGDDGFGPRPNASNTGIYPRAPNPQSGGTITASIFNEDITETVTVNANNLTISGCTIDGGTSPAVIINAGITGTRLLNSEFSTTGTGYVIQGPAPTQCLACHVHSATGKGFDIDDATLPCHVGYNFFDVAGNAINLDGSDVDQLVRVRYNTINSSSTTEDLITNQTGTLGRMAVYGNWLDGGDYCLYNNWVGGMDAYNNQFGRSANSGLLDEAQVITEWSGNVYEDDGTTANKTDTAPL